MMDVADEARLRGDENKSVTLRSSFKSDGGLKSLREDVAAAVAK